MPDARLSQTHIEKNNQIEPVSCPLHFSQVSLIVHWTKEDPTLNYSVMLKSMSSVSSSPSISGGDEDEEWDLPLSLMQRDTHGDYSDVKLKSTTAVAHASLLLENSIRRLKWRSFAFAYVLEVFVYGCKMAAHFSETTLAASAVQEGDDAEITPSMAMTSILVWNSLMDICAWATAIVVLYLPEERVRIWIRNLVGYVSMGHNYKNHSDVNRFRNNVSNYFLHGFVSAILSTGWYLLEQYQKHQLGLHISLHNGKNVHKQLMIHLLCLPWIIHMCWFCRLKPSLRGTEHKHSKYFKEDTSLTWLRIILVTTVYIFLGSELARRHLLPAEVGEVRYDLSLEAGEMQLNKEMDDLSVVDDYFG